MDVLPQWILKLQSLVGPGIAVLPLQPSLAPSDLSAEEGQIYSFPKSGVMIINQFPASDPRAALCEFILQREQALEKENDELEPLSKLLSGSYSTEDEWLQAARLIVDDFIFDGYFLCLEFQGLQQEMAANRQEIYEFLTEIGSPYAGMICVPFSKYEMDRPESQFRWGMYLPVSNNVSETGLLNVLSGWVDLVNQELFLQVRIGAGMRCGSFDRAFESFRQSLLALNAGVRFRPETRIFQYSQLGILHLLADLPKSASERFLDDFSIHKLTPELRETAWAFLKHNLSLSETARALYLHRNSVLYRLDKIAELTGVDIRSFEGSVLIWLSLHLLQDYEG